MMRRLILVSGTIVAMAGQAHAQTGPTVGSPESWGYAQFVAHSAYGNAPSQSYGAEIGFRIVKHLQVFAEGGRTTNVASAGLGATAKGIAQYLQRTQPGPAGFTAQEPMTFGVGGLKVLIPTGSRMELYALAGGGMATVKPVVHFFLAGRDVTGGLTSLGVELGTDLSGTFTKPMVVLGGGVVCPLWRHVALDFQYRGGRLMDGAGSFDTHLAGAGLGIRF